MSDLAARPSVRLTELESVIERGLATFVEVGQALLEIRDSRLYRDSHGTFEDYCRERWGFSSEYARLQMRASEVATSPTIVGLPRPSSEAVARELTPLRAEPDQLREAWGDVVELHGENPTAAQVREVVDERRGDKTTGQLLVASDENEWYTPENYIEAARRVLGAIDLDPASSQLANHNVGADFIYTANDDGLAKPWSGRLWLNPPYGRLAGDFITRLVAEHSVGAVTAAIALVNAHCTDTRWFQSLWDYTLCFTDHRIDFDSAGRDKANTSTHGSVFAYLGDNPAAFKREFADFGAVVVRA